MSVETVQNYKNYVEGKLSEVNKALEQTDLPEEVFQQLKTAKTGMEHELKFINFRLENEQKKSDLQVTRTVNGVVQQ